LGKVVYKSRRIRTEKMKIFIRTYTHRRQHRDTRQHIVTGKMQLIYIPKYVYKIYIELADLLNKNKFLIFSIKMGTFIFLFSIL
jgi:hypothetical protein